ncbi:response regulator [Flavobacterium sp. LC2016-12]|uniref:response regulator n=1 Tax=Flavobacterium sp. LC2016-12 TaxID=2783794 RepID=UPI00188DC1EF|nr:response regulator [Flavobacterium sp. LC2016-12]MBF4464250.1 response regulator [Flavobacterium sp. LC2016-12]
MKYSNILVIDDDAEDIEIFSEAVNSFKENITITAYTDASLALEGLKKAAELPDIIFLDLQMPRLTGKDFLQKIKEDDHLQNIPIIVLSGQSDVIMKDIYEKIGAHNFICKPNSYKELVEELRGILNI